MSTTPQDSESLRVMYEGLIKHNPNNTEAVHYLAVWHLERQSFLQVKLFYFGCQTTIIYDRNVSHLL
jgi:hypothetical protein